MHVKKNDKVIILTGKDRALIGEIIDVDREKRRVKVARRNMMIKHRKPNPITGDSGARIETENWIDASNVALYSEKLERGVRTTKRWQGAGGELFNSAAEAKASFPDESSVAIKKVRYAVKTGEIFE